ncbi:expressed unknown protein [Seminavis robusta]|uniref:Uncharacterized protein n=1 Tax=Seminavis robusta TaxID=568900 RepID=A0A9N8DKU1_9STRA|nr:expressed unknown protein [Seminavis robusta]|eukprot:Sro177_g077750.1 n/a (1337) ;mRNA; r:40859-44958
MSSQEEFDSLWDDVSAASDTFPRNEKTRSSNHKIRELDHEEELQSFSSSSSSSSSEEGNLNEISEEAETEDRQSKRENDKELRQCLLLMEKHQSRVGLAAQLAFQDRNSLQVICQFALGFLHSVNELLAQDEDDESDDESSATPCAGPTPTDHEWDPSSRKEGYGETSRETTTDGNEEQLEGTNGMKGGVPEEGVLLDGDDDDDSKLSISSSEYDTDDFAVPTVATWSFTVLILATGKTFETPKFSPSMEMGGIIFDLKDWVSEQEQTKEVFELRGATSSTTFHYDDIRLFHENEEILDDEDLFSAPQDSQLSLIVGCDLNIRCLDGKIWHLPFDHSCTVKDLKWRIRNRYSHIYPDNGFIVLLHQKVTLEDDDQRLCQIIEYNNHREQFEIRMQLIATIKTLNGNLIRVPFSPDCTVQDFCAKEELGIRPARQCFFLQSKSFDLGDPLMPMMENGTDIPSGSELYLLDLPNGRTAASNETDGEKGCSIPESAQRSVTLLQLKQIALEILLRCEKEEWTSIDPIKNSQKLKPEDVTLYDLMHYYVKPITREQKCSYAEHVSNAPHPPDWFVSHWWGESVFQFIACLEQHAHDRYLDKADEARYWICAYSNNQHVISDELGENPKCSSFFRALQLVEGVVSIMDANMVCFSRIWCGFEVAVALREIADQREAENRTYLYDVYSVHGSDPIKKWKQNVCVGLTDGPTQRDLKDAKEVAADAATLQVKRQSAFPPSPAALDICIEQGGATVEEDKLKILSYISGVRGSKPPTSHESYNEINALLAGKFAISTYPTALYNRQDMSPYRRALQNYQGLCRLTMDFSRFIGRRRDEAYINRLRGEARHIVSSLPVSLEELRLDYSRFRFETSEEFSAGLRRLLKLKTLKLRAKRLNDLVSIDCLLNEISQLSNLQHLRLDFAECMRLKSISMGRPTISKLVNAKMLQLDFSCCQLASVDNVFAEVGNLSGLRELVLNFGYNDKIRNINYAGSISKIAALQKLELVLSDCGLSTINSLLEETSECPTLTELRIDVSSNEKLGAITRKGGGMPSTSDENDLNEEKPDACMATTRSIRKIYLLSKLSQIEMLQLSFASCNLSCATVEVVLRDIGKLKGLRKLHLDFASNPQIGQFKPKFLEPIARLTSLESLSIDFSSCKKFSFAGSLETSVYLLHFKRLKLDLHSSDQLTHLEGLATAIFRRQDKFEHFTLAVNNCSLPLSAFLTICRALAESRSQASWVELDYQENPGEKFIDPQLAKFTGTTADLRRRLEEVNYDAMPNGTKVKSSIYRWMVAQRGFRPKRNTLNGGAATTYAQHREQVKIKQSEKVQSKPKAQAQSTQSEH